MGGLELKRLPVESVGKALERADHYRELNQPDEAESICRDVLMVAPDDMEAVKLLGLALTDRFATAWMSAFDEAQALFERLPSEYERAYYCGIAWERFGKAQLEAGQAHNAAHAFEQALEQFARAEPLAPPGSPDPVLRWNRCVRLLNEHPELSVAHSSPPIGSRHSVLGD